MILREGVTDLEALADKLYEIRDRIEVAQLDHPEDANLKYVYDMLTEILEELEDEEG